MRIFVFAWLERLFTAIECWAGDMAVRVALCKNCGRNRYTGEPCVGRKA